MQCSTSNKINDYYINRKKNLQCSTITQLAERSVKTPIMLYFVMIEYKFVHFAPDHDRWFKID